MQSQVGMEEKNSDASASITLQPSSQIKRARSDNNEGSAKKPTASSSKVSHFKGVSWSRGNSLWQVGIQANKKKRHLGYFKEEEAAARKYDEAAEELGRQVNFPTEASGVQALKGGRGGTSRFIGVSWHKSTHKWEAGIKIAGKKTGLGHFADELEAARKYDEAAIKIGRSLNFPRDAEVAYLPIVAPLLPQATPPKLEGSEKVVTTLDSVVPALAPALPKPIGEECRWSVAV